MKNKMRIITGITLIVIIVVTIYLVVVNKPSALERMQASIKGKVDLSNIVSFAVKDNKLIAIDKQENELHMMDIVKINNTRENIELRSIFYDSKKLYLVYSEWYKNPSNEKTDNVYMIDMNNNGKKYEVTKMIQLPSSSEPIVYQQRKDILLGNRSTI